MFPSSFYEFVNPSFQYGYECAACASAVFYGGNHRRLPLGSSLNLVNLMDQFAEAGRSPQLQTHLIPHNYTAALKPRIDAEVCWERLCRV